ncbi:MAG: phenylalanine--tRNA ligase subunit beta [Deltaproteobacteria bacterium]|nr:phenylalanine--tRNA ligase subunit beta [Deltaproteobacteria bacterium]
MNVTWNWLKEFTPCLYSPEELAHRLTMAGLEVEGLRKFGEGLDSVIVARLESVDPHPDAERLTLCRVDTGTERLQIVCGAKNHKTGDLVALAQVGSVLPGDFKIKKSKIRGCESQGMLCSEKELGLAEESAGILILPPDAPVGRPVFEALGLKDVRFEIGLTPNRSDCLSVLGIAREVAALGGQTLRFSPPRAATGEGDIRAFTSVEVHEPGHCPRYAARLIRGIAIGPSPAWLARRLESVGLRSINNVVDVTNYVMMELGQPLHAFDFNLLRGRRIVVRRAAAGELFTTLDGKQHTLEADDLMICDGVGAVALAGVMGGENSEIRPETCDVLLESAYFNPMTVRRTSKRLGIHTEASHRFERGVDIDMTPVALERATRLILETAGGTAAQGRIDVFGAPPERPPVTISTARCNAILGVTLKAERIRELLSSIGLSVTPGGDLSDDMWRVAIPSWRHDLEREIDLIEEVARLHGYDEIPATLPGCGVDSWLIPEAANRVARIRQALTAAGFSEVVNYSFVSPGCWDKIRLAADDSRRRAVPLLNPLAEDQSVMRTTLVPSMLEVLARNLSYRCRDLRLFELRPVFSPRSTVGKGNAALERLSLCLALCGRRAPEGWAQSNEPVDFFDLKGAVENLIELFGLGNVCFVPDGGEPFLHPGKSALLKNGERVLGFLGEVHPQVLGRFDIELPVLICELDLEALWNAPTEARKFRPLSRFPNVQRDTALVVNLEVSAQAVMETVHGVGSRYFEEAVLFDLYGGPGIPEGKKSLAIRVRYRSDEKTLTDDEVNGFHQRIVEALVKRLGAVIR